jgi:hypothetical protein
MHLAVCGYSSQIQLTQGIAMTTPNIPPIACTLAPRDYLARLAWIAELARDALRGFERRDLVLHLRYVLEAGDRDREMVRKEQVCCAFLTFELQETPHEIQLTVRAPEGARGALDMLFGQFSPQPRSAPPGGVPEGTRGQ